MIEVNYSFTYKVLEQVTDLPESLQQLLKEAKEAVNVAYSPYSNFKVGAAVLLENGKIITGSNQENASSPVGICAERVALSAASAVYPDVPITALAISARGRNIEVVMPVPPCGLCRQTILEYEERFGREIELILQGESGKIFWIKTVKDLLPLYFGQYDVK